MPSPDRTQGVQVRWPSGAGTAAGTRCGDPAGGSARCTAEHGGVDGQVEVVVPAAAIEIDDRPSPIGQRAINDGASEIGVGAVAGDEVIVATIGPGKGGEQPPPLKGFADVGMIRTMSSLLHLRASGRGILTDLEGEKVPFFNREMVCA